MRNILLIGAVAAAATLTGCSFSIGGDTPTNVAEEAIEGDLADQAGLTDVTADCEEVSSDAEVGSTFTCTSTSDVGDIDWLATIQEDDIVNVQSLNLLSAEDVVALEEAAVDVIEQQSGRRLGYENYSCGVGPIGLAGDSILNCELIDPDNGDVYDSTLEITDFDTGAFNVDVADQPRG